MVVKEKELLKIMTPAIDLLCNKYGIECLKYDNDKENSEILSLEFVNNSNESCSVIILIILGTIHMKFEEEEIEEFDIKKLVTKILKKLC